MIAWMAGVALASLLGSMHCSAMCGPIAIWATSATAKGGCGSSVGSHGGLWHAAAAYHFGRLATYASLGAIAGLLGGVLDRGGSLVGFQQSAAWLAGGTMILVGLSQLLPVHRTHAMFAIPHTRLGQFLARGRVAVARLPRGLRAAAIGGMTGLLPCGWLYLFVLIAAGGGSIASGLATMTAFWVGTLPWLTAVLAGAAMIGQTRSGSLLKPLTAALIIAAGLSTMLWRSQVDLSNLRSVPLTEVSSTPLPCCRHAAEANR